MTTLNEIVNVQIDRQTESVDQANFGIPLFVVEVSSIDALVTTYTNIDAVLEDYATTDVAYKMAAAAFSQEIRPDKIKIGQKLDTDTWVDGITDISEADDDWYGLAVETVAAADILLIAAYIEAKTKIYIARSADADVLTTATDDIASDLQAAEYNRTALIYDANAATAYADAAWLGNCLVRDPGSQTWKFKTLTGITYNALSATEKQNAIGKGANVYIRLAGTNITNEGTVASGEFIDIIRGIDWLKARIQENVYSKLINAPKIPFTNAGIAIIETVVREQLDVGIERDLIAIDPAYTVTVPDVLDTQEADRQNRKLTPVNFRARLAGAIHFVEIRGVVYA